MALVALEAQLCLVDKQNFPVSDPPISSSSIDALITYPQPNRAGLLNSLAGLISTLINVYSQQSGRFSITARITIGVTASCTVVTAVLYFLYNFWILQGVRKKHEKELELEAGKRATYYELADNDSHE